MFLGLRTAVYVTPNLDEAKQWYSKVFECEPYFDEPFYVGYSVGGFELGLVPDGEPGTKMAHLFWGCPDIVAELARLGKLGVQVHEDVADVGGGIKVASIVDPFGNKIGLIENPHFSRDAVR